jgi:hypothetical protein
MSYYNTTSEAPEQVQIFKTSNNKQDEIVLNIIKSLNKPFSASQIYKRYPVANVPITSIRRSINTLKNTDLISETGERVKGMFGRSELQYNLRKI